MTLEELLAAGQKAAPDCELHVAQVLRTSNGVTHVSWSASVFSRTEYCAHGGQKYVAAVFVVPTAEEALSGIVEQLAGPRVCQCAQCGDARTRSGATP